MAKKEKTNIKRVSGKEASHRAKLRKERENRIRSKQKQSQKKRLNSELFEMVRKDNIDALDNESKEKVISEIYNLIISFPEENYDKIDLLLEFLQDKNLKIIMRTMKNLQNLFIDILPSYKIRLDGDNQKKSGNQNKSKNHQHENGTGFSYSKEVESLHTYEKNLLKYYEKFINLLSIFLRTFSSSKKSASKESISKFLQFIVEILSKLFEKFYLFNHSENIYKILVEKLTDSNLNIRKKSFESLRTVLSLQDNATNILELKYEMIKLISHIVFIKSHDKFDPNVLELFTCHKIEFPDFKKESEDLKKLADIKMGSRDSLKMESDIKTKKQMQIEKKEKKNLIREKERIVKNLKKEMGEYDNHSSSRAIFHINLKIIKKILLVFFDILKFKKDSSLIRSVLAGIGVLCENINIEILLDLQKCIYEYINHTLNQNENQDKKIFCITALKSCLNITEKLTKDIISIEDSNLTNTTYFFLSKITEKENVKKLTKDDLFILLEILDALLLKNRQYSLDIVASYIKRLAIFTLSLDRCFVPAFLLFLKRVFQRYPNLSTMRENDEDMFDYAIVSDPSICSGKQSNIYKEIQKISDLHKDSKIVKKLIEYLKKDDKINPQLATLSYYDMLLSL